MSPDRPKDDRRKGGRPDRRNVPRGGRRAGDANHEPRKAIRLRELLDTLQAAVFKNRRDLDIQFERIAQIQRDLDLLKRRLP
jgi:hypothetical protein